jgi:hypothetical protein
VLGFTAADRVCLPVPFYHCFGMVMGNLGATSHGACIVIPAPAFDPGATLQAVAEERCTTLYGVPTMFIAELADPTFGSADLSSLRTGIMAGSPCPIEVMRQVIDVLGAREITIGYGQTEASPIITQSRNTDPIEIRVETVGRVLPGLEVKIIDPSTGATLDGVHSHDDLLEDLSRQGIEQHTRALAGFSRRLQDINTNDLTPVEKAEQPMVAADIQARIFEHEQTRTWERNPQLYADTICSSIASQVVFSYAPLPERARRVLSKLRQTARLRSNVAQTPDGTGNPARISSPRLPALPPTIGSMLASTAARSSTRGCEAISSPEALLISRNRRLVPHASD